MSGHDEQRPNARVGVDTGKQEVSSLELFFDLVFAFAISQVSAHLAHDHSWRGAAQSVVLLVAVLTVWSYTSWAATMASPDRRQTQWMLLVTMMLGLWMNAALGSAFGDSAWPFVIPLLAIQLGRTLWTISVTRNPVFRGHFIRAFIWLAAASPLWIAGAVTQASDVRLAWWATAAIVEVLGAWFAHPLPGRWLRSENLPFDAGHMLERCSLFVLIALGETVLTTGASIAATPTNPQTLATGAAAFVSIACLWAMAYGRAYEFALRHPRRAHDPVRVSRFAMNAVMVMSAGLVAVAVANEEVIAEPLHPSRTAGLMLGGGPMLFLFAQSWYHRALSGRWSLLHLAGAAAVFLVGLSALMLRPQAALVAVALVLVTLAAIDRSNRRVDLHSGV